MKQPDKFPPRFTERIQQILPENEWADFFRYATEPLPKTIRIKSSPLSKGELAVRPRAHDREEGDFPVPTSWTLKPITGIDEAHFITREDQGTIPLGKTLEHFTGHIYVQSLSSMLSVLALDPQPGEKILDLAAAPGSKSTFIADRMANTGTLVVNEPSSSRSAKLVSNLDRLGITNVVVLQSDGNALPTYFGQEFDRILLDAPCSSEGFGRRDSQFFRKMWSERSIFQAAKLQKKLIVSAFEMLRPDGVLIYSTCTSAPEENEAVVQHLLDRYPDQVEIEPVDFGAIPVRAGIAQWNEQLFSSKVTENVRRIWPHLRSEGWDSELFFVAKIRKIAPLARPPAQKKPPRNAPQLLKKNHSAEIFAKLCKTFGLERSFFAGKALLERNHTYSLTTKEAAHFAQKNPHRRAGLPILHAHHGKPPEITSQFALQYGHLATKNIIELSPPEKDRWLAGYDLSLSSSPSFLKRGPAIGSEAQARRGGVPDGTIILIRHGQYCLGHGKVQKNGTKLKNKLSRDLVFA